MSRLLTSRANYRGRPGEWRRSRLHQVIHLLSGPEDSGLLSPLLFQPRSRGIVTRSEVGWATTYARSVPNQCSRPRIETQTLVD